MCEESLGIPGQNHCGHGAANVVPEEPAYVHPIGCAGHIGVGSGVHATCGASGEVSRVGHDGNERCVELETAGGVKGWTASVAPPAFPNRCKSGTEIDQEHGGPGDADSGKFGSLDFSVGLASSNEPLLTEGLSQGPLQEVEDHDIAAADWLDVAHALLDAATESGDAC